MSAGRPWTPAAGSPATVTELVEAQAARTPDAPAVHGDGRVVSYAELDGRANGLACHLQELGVGPDVPVAVLVPRSVSMTVGLLAILKAGGACLPIDASLPAERVGYLLADSGAPVVLTVESLLGLVAGQPATVVRVDEWGERGVRQAAPARATRPEHLAYVIYTSGSTGAPKGVMLTHRGLVNHHQAVAELYQLGSGDRVLQFCSPSFDVSVEEMFPTWASGATVVLRDDRVPILGGSWLEWLRRKRVTVLNLPTAYWHEWVWDLRRMGAVVPESIRLVTVGGEKALGGAYRAWLQVGGDAVRWVNAYGPTEATIMATWYEPDPAAVAAASWDDPPIGRTLANTTAHILDGTGRLVVPGDSGELYLGGPGVARGYLGRPELTSERFVPDSFVPDSLIPDSCSDQTDARLYRTGDQVRARSDGNLEFLGRLDQQVKVRGFRIECGEVEAALLTHPDIVDAVVIAREDSPGTKRLVGYVVTAPAADDQAVTSQALRHFLGERLPPYMVPTAFVVLEAFPITAGGKVDRGGFPAPARSRQGTGAAPATATEAVLATIWSQVLGIDGMGVDEDFFDLGGQSLLATQVVAQVREALGIELAVHAIFESPSLRSLAAAVDEIGARGPSACPLVAHPGRTDEPVALSLPQEQMWALELDASPPGLYNITALHRFSGPVDGDLLQQALDYLVGRHDALRTRFTTDTDEGRISQIVAETATAGLAITDLSRVTVGDRPSEADQQDVLERHVAAQDAQPFDLGTAPLLRAALFRLGDDRSVVAVTFDHLISDGTSAYIFLSELADTYGALAGGRRPALVPLPVQYPDFARWQRQWVTEERQRVQLEYWREALDGMPQGPAVAFDQTPSAPSRRIAARSLAVPPEAYRALNRLAREERATMFVVAVALVDTVLHAAGGATDIVLSTTLSGRQRAETDGVIGYFANIGRIRTGLTGDPAFPEIVARARASVLGLFEHQDMPFMRVRQALFPTFGAGAGAGAGSGSGSGSRVAGAHPLAALPVELQYFHAGQDGWAPGLGVVERPGPDKGPDQLFFRGQLHPLSISLLDDGSQWWGEINYKVDFYHQATIERLAAGFERLAAMVAGNPRRSLSELAAVVAMAGAGDHIPVEHRPVGTWRLEA